MSDRGGDSNAQVAGNGCGNGLLGMIELQLITWLMKISCDWKTSTCRVSLISMPLTSIQVLNINSDDRNDDAADGGCVITTSLDGSA